ncbi:MAG: VWA domain-containing protein [Acidobacteriota bacterium]|nr:VWA domain-containing protein [Acidobacteriota bacterium]
MRAIMQLRGFILFLASWTLTTGLCAQQDSPQSSEPDTLPSAPSASVRQQRKPTPPAPAVAPVPAPTDAKAESPKSQTPSASDKTAAPVEAADTTIRRTVNEVNVVFTVTDRHGHYVNDLKKNDFQVLDDNKPAAEIRSFHRETDLPLQVGLLVDASNSVRDRFKFEQESAIEFLSQTIRPKYDRAFVVGFDVTPEVTQDFTDNTEALSVGVRALRPGGGTAMYDALYFACRDKLLKEQQDVAVRRAVILLSDGDDNQSHVTREEAIEMSQRAEVVVYTISTNVSGSPDRGDKVLQRIAEATGGRAFFPFQIRDVANAFAEIQNELRSQYALSYKPAELAAGGRYHSIEIIAQNHKGLKIRSRHGYYAPAQ